MDVFKTLLISTPGSVGSSVAITGGSINGTNIGATTPGTGAFTSLTASGNSDLSGSLTVGGQIITNTGTAADPIISLNGTANGFYYTGSNVVRVSASGGQAANFSSTVTNILATTASTSTTTGALIVSGGVGVAKAIFGGDILGACGDDRVLLSWNGSVDTYYVSANYANANGTESVTNSSRGSWRTGMRVATSPRVSWGWRAGSAGAGTFTELMYLTSAGDVSIAGTTASTSTTTGALVVSGGIGAAGAANVGTYYGMVDGVTAPGATVGYAKIYVDTADGDLKVIFGDGTIKTLATDT